MVQGQLCLSSYNTVLGLYSNYDRLKQVFFFFPSLLISTAP